MKYLYFAYGMNTNLDSMKTRCPEAECLGPAELVDYQLEFAHHCNVKFDLGLRVPGLLWAITERDLDSLDITEGYPYYYTREGAVVEHAGETKLAIVYTMVGPTDLSPPTEYYWNLVQAGYQQNSISQRELVRALNNSYETSTAF
jgi:gamma-glutamylcyclotransferase (GGCT)/AIG2-like uncharacterized protein YtfP